MQNKDKRGLRQSTCLKNKNFTSFQRKDQLTVAVINRNLWSSYQVSFVSFSENRRFLSPAYYMSIPIYKWLADVESK